MELEEFKKKNKLSFIFFFFGREPGEKYPSIILRQKENITHGFVLVVWTKPPTKKLYATEQQINYHLFYRRIWSYIVWKNKLFVNWGPINYTPNYSRNCYFYLSVVLLRLLLISIIFELRLWACVFIFSGMHVTSYHFDVMARSFVKPRMSEWKK